MSDRATTILMFLLGIAVTAAIALAVVVFTGDDTGTTTIAATSLDTSTTVAEITTTTTVADTTTTAAATTTSSAPACAGTGVAVPTSGSGVTTASGDFDGDGAIDLLVAYPAADGTSRVAMRLSYGYGTEMEVFGPAMTIGAQQFDGETAWVGISTFDSGASTTVFGFFQLDGCTIAFSQIDGGGEASFIWGGGVTHLDGMACWSNGITARAVSTGDGINWEYLTTDYSRNPVLREFHFEGAASSTLTSPGDDDVIFGAAELNCPFVP